MAPVRNLPEAVEIIEAPGDGVGAVRFSGDGRLDDESRFGEGHANECEHHRCAGRVRERHLRQRSGGVARTMSVCRRSGEGTRIKGVSQEESEAWAMPSDRQSRTLLAARAIASAAALGTGSLDAGIAVPGSRERMVADHSGAA